MVKFDTWVWIWAFTLLVAWAYSSYQVIAPLVKSRRELKQRQRQEREELIRFRDKYKSYADNRKDNRGCRTARE